MKNRIVLLTIISAIGIVTGCSNKENKSLDNSSILSVSSEINSDISEIKTTHNVKWVDEDGTLLELDENVDDTNPSKYDGKEPTKDGYEFKGWKESLDDEKNVIMTAQYEEIHIDKNLFGTWYVHTSMTGVVPTNFRFAVNSDKTITLLDTSKQYVLTFKGYYDGFENTYLFYYGTIKWIVSFDSTDTNPGVDWGYYNTNEYDMGFARDKAYSKYEYEGETFPNQQVKDYLKTTLDLIPYESDYYYLDCFNSSLYDCKSIDIEIRDTTFARFKSYLNSLSSKGYIFNSYDSNNVKTDTFYVGYDETKTYSVRLIYFSEDNQADLFYYNYLEKLHA